MKIDGRFAHSSRKMLEFNEAGVGASHWNCEKKKIAPAGRSRVTFFRKGMLLCRFLLLSLSESESMYQNI